MVIRGIYTSATGMIAEMARLNVIANNLANADTTGFKTDNLVSGTFREMMLNAIDKNGATPIGRLGLGTTIADEYSDASNGVLTETGSIYDLALQGEAYFTVATPNGEKYSRAGNFRVDRDGYLATNEGYRVLGENGPIRLEGKFEVDASGEIALNGTVIDKLRLVGKSGLTKEGCGFYDSDRAVMATDYQVYQGALEHSNVEVIKQMVEMITVSRNYESNQRVLAAQDETLGKAVNQLAE